MFYDLSQNLLESFSLTLISGNCLRRHVIANSSSADTCPVGRIVVIRACSAALLFLA
jgi:hypothetical protein